MNRTQARHLLMPGIREKLSASTRLAPFTDEEIESAVDAYCDGGINSAVARIGELCALPLSARRHQAALTPLRSVSAAYKLSKLPLHLRSNQEKTYEPRKSVKAPACRAVEAESTGGNGGAQAAARDVAKLQLEQQRRAVQAYYNNVYTSAAGYSHPFSSSLQGIGANLFGAQNSLGNLYSIPFSAAFTPVEPPKPLPVEIKAGELTAWRIWRLRAGGVLVSTAQEFVWKEGDVVEGDIDAGYGVHAWKTEASAREMAKEYLGYGEDVAIGTVELWGHVIEHDEGYRAQYGQIKEIVERIEAPATHLALVGNNAAVAPLRKQFDPGVAWLGIAFGLSLGGGFAALVVSPVVGGVVSGLGFFMLAVAGMVAIHP